ncbi:MAG: GYDIA family GHMP kinase [Flavobacteriaceae bacterium]
MSKQTFYSNGKLLLTGEYTVLDGAKALALPTTFGQSLEVETNDSNTISWKSFDADKSVWLDVVLPIDSIKNQTFSTENSVEQKLAEILYEAYKLNPSFLEGEKGFEVKTFLTFPRFWGLGTSSTLINNIAQWLKINPYELLKNTFSGSGYDIACASHNTAVLYQLKNGKSVVETVNFRPNFTQNLYFVYLNKKQNSRTAIANYQSKKPQISEIVEQINHITGEILQAKSLADFCSLSDQHEAVMSQVLEMPTVKKLLFPDFNGSIKSLGAWGGDFVLVASEQDPTDYFKNKGFETVIPYEEMILKS